MAKEIIVRLSPEKAKWLKERIIAAIKASTSNEDVEGWIDLYVQVKEAEKYPVGDDDGQEKTR